MASEIRRAMRQIEERRGRRRVELCRLLSEGSKLKQDGRIWPDCSSFLPQYNTPAHLARHLEAREFGFGWPVEVYVW